MARFSIKSWTLNLQPRRAPVSSGLRQPPCSCLFSTYLEHSRTYGGFVQCWLHTPTESGLRIWNAAGVSSKLLDDFHGSVSKVSYNLWELLFTPRLHFRHASTLFVKAVLYKQPIFVTHLLAGLILGLGRSGHSQFFVPVQRDDSEVFEWLLSYSDKERCTEMPVANSWTKTCVLPRSMRPGWELSDGVMC